MTIQFIIALGCSVPFASIALGQISSFTLDFKENTVTVAFNTPRGVPTPAIIGAPYSADQVSESVQTLADGIHITQTSNARHFVRDSQGRTRTERPILVTRDANAWSLAVIEIRDPVEGFYYILDQENKLAHRFVTLTAPARTAPAVQEAGSQTQAATASSRRVIGSDHAENSSEKLGSQMMEGVMVEGHKSTTTWPVGTQGNDRPIVTTYESWFSQDLKTDVLTKQSNPRSGESTFKLTHIQRTEPDATLFQAPPDYIVVDEKGSFTMTATRH